MDVFNPARGYHITSSRMLVAATKTVKFGDGYEMGQAVGVNPVSEKWRLKFNGLSKAEADAIESFWRGHIKLTFLYTLRGVERLWQFDGNYDDLQVGVTFEINLMIKQVFL